jgi:glycerol kinase
VNKAAPAPFYLCLDQGGHASRALVFDARGEQQASALREVSVRSLAPDRVEQSPEELVSSLKAVIAEAVAALGERADDLVSAGIATQRSSIVCWDRYSGAALSPVISWQDRRAQAWLDQFSADTDEIHQRTGLMLSAHYGASKLRWCLDHLPEVAAAQRDGRLVMGPLASFLLFRLLDEKPLLADPANASRTLLWNLHTNDWEPWLLERFGIAAESLPRCVPTRHAFGTLRVNERRVPLRIATGDQSAALFSLGTALPTKAYINMGTGAFIQRVIDQAPAANGLLTSLVYRDAERSVVVREGTVNGAAAALTWAEQKCGLKNIDADLNGWLVREGELPVFLNGVSGLGAPFWVAAFESRWVGAGEPWQKICAVAESIVFLLQTNLERLRSFPPALTQLVVSGGLARHDGLCQRLADLSGLPVHRPAEHEATARGTAFLLAGFPETWPETKPGMTFAPSPNSALTRRYQRWLTQMNAALNP